jgi:hypothetical protein
MSEYREYGFDVKLTALIRVPARSESEARALLAQTFEIVNGRFGTWPNGQQIIAEACTLISREELFEIDGKDVCPSSLHWRLEHRTGNRTHRLLRWTKE